MPDGAGHLACSAAFTVARLGLLPVSVGLAWHRHVVLGAVCLAFTSLMLMVAKRCAFVAGAEGHLAKRDLSGMADADRAALAV